MRVGPKRELGAACVGHACIATVLLRQDGLPTARDSRHVEFAIRVPRAWHEDAATVLERHQGVIRASSSRHQGVIGASSWLHNGVIRVPSGRRQRTWREDAVAMLERLWAQQRHRHGARNHLRVGYLDDLRSSREQHAQACRRLEDKVTAPRLQPAEVATLEAGCRLPVRVPYRCVHLHAEGYS